MIDWKRLEAKLVRSQVSVLWQEAQLLSTAAENSDSARYMEKLGNLEEWAAELLATVRATLEPFRETSTHPPTTMKDKSDEN